MSKIIEELQMNKSIKFTFSILLMGIFLLLMTFEGYSESYDPNVSPIFLKQTQTRETRTVSNAGNWSYWMQYDGLSGYNPILSLSGGTYPRGTSQAIFQDGVVWGAFVRDTSSQNPRVGGQTYNIGTSAGRILVPGTDPVGAGSAVAQPASEVQLYRINVDYTVPFDQLSEDDQANALRVLRQDVSEVNAINVSDVSDQQVIDAVNQYAADYANWPAEAPRNKDGTPGIANADQVVWFVVNDLDIGRTSSLYGSGPMGLELQVTAWSYNQPSTALGQVIYKQYKIINKSGVTMDSMFISQWSDPDVGDSGDDFAGCDTVLSIGFAYNGYLVDRNYALVNLPPPAAGYDFFAGPLVQGVAGEDLNKNGIDDGEDYGIKNLKKVGPGLINLPMTAFIYFAAGSAITDPPLRDYEGTIEWYKMLRGYIPNNPDPGDLVRYKHGSGPYAGIDTPYPLNGDPFAETGDLDGRGSNFGPGDRRIALCSGPFTMAPGDTQEIVLALVGGIIEQTGGNNRNAVIQMKLNDQFAQLIFDSLFKEIPKPPAAPQVATLPERNNLAFEWGSNLAAVNETENTVVLGFEFEGYNVYQLPSPTSSKTAAKLVATYDKINNVGYIRAPRFLPEFKDVVEVPIQFGTDNGIQRYFNVTKDYINDTPLYPGNEYYFVVTAYNYNPEFPDPALESPFSGQVISITPQDPKPGIIYSAQGSEILPVTHASGSGDAPVEPIVVNPAELIDANWEVTFNSDTTFFTPDSYDVANSYNLSRDGQLLVDHNPNFSLDYRANPIYDGILFTIGSLTFDAPLDYSGHPVTPASNAGNYDLASYTDFGDPNSWAITSWGFGTTNVDTLQNDVKIVWDGEYDDPITYQDSIILHPIKEGTGSIAMQVGARNYDFTLNPYRGMVSNDETPEGYFQIRIPFKVYDNATGEQINCIVYDRSQAFPAAGDFYPWNPSDRMYIWIMDKPYDGELTYPDGADGKYLTWNQVYWESHWTYGDEIIWQYANPIVAGVDRYTFSTTAPVNSLSAAKEEVKKINVFPNPYYAYNPSETSRFDRFVTFSHLPRKATIRIFNLGGVQVRKIDKDSDTQFQKWDLLNENDLPVASGMYIAYIDMPDLGKTKVLKVMIIQGQQIIESY
jgi:hypothetical protein